MRNPPTVHCDFCGDLLLAALAAPAACGVIACPPCDMSRVQDEPDPEDWPVLEPLRSPEDAADH